VRAIEATGGGYRLEGTEYTNLVYADDVAILSESPGRMEKTLRNAQRTASVIGLRFNPLKCATLHIKGGGEPGGSYHRDSACRGRRFVP
jgi:hypothetical protein